MRSVFIGKVTMYGGEPMQNAVMTLENEPGAPCTLKVGCGEKVCGYVTGGEAAVIKEYLLKGMKLYCLAGEPEEKEKGVRHTVKVYYTPGKI